jgi:hypothetical protein
VYGIGRPASLCSSVADLVINSSISISTISCRIEVLNRLSSPCCASICTDYMRCLLRTRGLTELLLLPCRTTSGRRRRRRVPFAESVLRSIPFRSVLSLSFLYFPEFEKNGVSALSIGSVETRSTVHIRSTLKFWTTSIMSCPVLCSKNDRSRLKSKPALGTTDPVHATKYFSPL